MSTQEAIVVVLVGAIFANVALSVGLIVGPRLRARRDAHEAALREAAGMTPGSRSGSVAGSVPGGALPRALGGRPVPGGLGPAFEPRLVAPREPAPPASLSPVEPADAPTDGVTGLDLTPTWSKWLSEEESRIDRYGRPATIVLFELGGLDRLAERLGPEAADRLIPPIATTVRRHARASDNIARLGRARFGALLPETDEIRAINYVERIRSACDVWLESGAVALRLSIGWAEIAADQPVEVAVQAAERRLNEERQRLPLADLVVDGESDVQAAMQARG
jgi:diguanylate cyclase (GGDEF)-like protein